MKKYIKPMMEGQMFVANEYVAACWGVGCSVNNANQYEKDHRNWQGGQISHGADHCGMSGNQVIYDDNNDGTADRMVEIGTDGLGTLACTIYTDSTYTRVKSVSSVKAEEYIYWTTAAGSKVWHHQGTVFNTVPNHPNRS